MNFSTVVNVMYSTLFTFYIRCGIDICKKINIPYSIMHLHVQYASEKKQRSVVVHTVWLRYSLHGIV